MTKHQISRKAAFALSALLVAVLSGCSDSREGQIVRDKDGNYYELTTEELMFMPDEAYRLHKIDTTKFDVKGFKNFR